MNGTMFVVSDAPALWPERRLMTSSGYGTYPGPEEAAKRMPSDKDMQIITPERAQELFGTTSATNLDGVTFHVNDPKQFLSHYL